MNNITYEEIKKKLILWKEQKDEEAFIWLVKKNIYLVYYIAQKYVRKGLSFDELKSAGLEGLVKAICRFNYNYKNVNLKSFKSYMSKCIENQIITDIKNNSRHSNEISISEPIKSSKDDELFILEEVLESPEKDPMDQVIYKIEDSFVENALALLSPKERKIICLRYGLKENEILTLNEIGKMYNCSRQAISSQEQKALKKMKKAPNASIMQDIIKQ